MRSIWSTVSWLAVVHLLALGLVGAWLWTSGRLDGEKARALLETVLEPVDGAEDVVEAGDDGPDGASQSAEAVEAALIEQRRARLVEQRLADLHARLRADLAMAMDEAGATLARVEDRQRGLAEAQESAQDAEAQAALEAVVRQYELVPPKQAKKMFMALIADGEVERAVEYLGAMQDRAKSKVLREFKTDAEVAEARPPPRETIQVISALTQIPPNPASSRTPEPGSLGRADDRTNFRTMVEDAHRDADRDRPSIDQAAGSVEHAATRVDDRSPAASDAGTSGREPAGESDSDPNDRQPGKAGGSGESGSASNADQRPSGDGRPANGDDRPAAATTGAAAAGSAAGETDTRTTGRSADPSSGQRPAAPVSPTNAANTASGSAAGTAAAAGATTPEAAGTATTATFTNQATGQSSGGTPGPAGANVGSAGPAAAAGTADGTAVPSADPAPGAGGTDADVPDPAGEDETVRLRFVRGREAEGRGRATTDAPPAQAPDGGPRTDDASSAVGRRLLQVEQSLQDGAGQSAGGHGGDQPRGDGGERLTTAARAEASAASRASTEEIAARFVSRVGNGLRALAGQRGGTMHMRLDPPELGRLHVEMQIRGGTVSAIFRASDASAHRLLEEHMTTLRGTLERQGLQVERLQVQSPSGNDGSSTDRHGQHDGERQDQQQKDAAGRQSAGRDDQRQRRGDHAADGRAFDEIAGAMTAERTADRTDATGAAAG